MTKSLHVMSILVALLPPVFSSTAYGDQTQVWIDADPACDSQRRHDVDDCWALVQALAAQSLNIRGISIVFGNSEERKGFASANSLLEKFADTADKPSVYRGAGSAIDQASPQATPASEAMAAALSTVTGNGAPEQKITIIALGPLTNIATLLLDHPELAIHIEQIVAVAGQRSQQRARFYPGQSRLFHVHDFNLRKDSEAFAIVLDSDIPITLMPFEIGQQISIDNTDLNQLAGGSEGSQWLSEISKPWLDFWLTTFKDKGFHPFDSLAVGIVTNPDMFTCEEFAAKIDRRPAFFVSSRDRLLVSRDYFYSDDRKLQYCYDVESEFKATLLEEVS